MACQAAGSTNRSAAPARTLARPALSSKRRWRHRFLGGKTMLQGIRRAVAAPMITLVCGVGADAAAQTATARIADFPRSDGTFYIVEAINGKEVPNALDRSRAAS